ncbi:MAG: DUF3027 domain-containing protein [Mycobacteriales bacterium]
MSPPTETPARPAIAADPDSVRSGPASAGSPDAACLAAVDAARTAAVEAAGGEIGAHLDAVAEGQRVVTHLFAATVPGYEGWRWAVSVVRAPRRTNVTVDEVALLPGPDALLAPAWVPWDQRLRSGDLSPGDLVPHRPADPRLVPAYLRSDDPAVEEVATEIGLGREKVLSVEGRTEAAERWWAGDTGPRTAMASHAPAGCGSCGFYLPLAGSLRSAFGVCGNEFGAGDGRVVAASYGCGAHSDVEATDDPTPADPGEFYDDGELEVLSLD